MKSVILPVAGKGSRLLPLTKATPKELLPVFDKPVIQFAIDEAVAAGAERVVVVTHSNKPSIAKYFETENGEILSLRSQEKHSLANILEACGSKGEIEVVFAYQDKPLGLGHAVLCAAADVLDGPVGVILPDDVILGTPCLKEMHAAYEGGNMVAAMQVPSSQVPKYGIFDITDNVEAGVPVLAKGMVEKPTIEVAPSNLAAVGRYILSAKIFDVLEETGLGAGGEYQLTDAIAKMINSCGLTALPFSGHRFDCGSHAGLLEASNARYLEMNKSNRTMTAAE